MDIATYRIYHERSEVPSKRHLSYRYLHVYPRTLLSTPRRAEAY